MSECANCNVSVYVPDGYEFEEGDMCMSCTKQELDSSWKLVDRLGKLLHDTANVLHGGPMENGLWSYHDIPELTAKLKESLERKEYYDAMRSREIDMTNIPEKERPFVAALLNQRDDYYKQMTKAKERTSKLEDCIRELLKGGEHEGECSEGDLSLSSSWEVGPCVKHLQASETRETAARKLLEENNATGPKG